MVPTFAREPAANRSERFLVGLFTARDKPAATASAAIVLQPRPRSRAVRCAARASTDEKLARR
jgi:hypothetical protein